MTDQPSERAMKLVSCWGGSVGAKRAMLADIDRHFLGYEALLAFARCQHLVCDCCCAEHPDDRCFKCAAQSALAAAGVEVT